jgi:hypothetical protein
VKDFYLKLSANISASTILDITVAEFVDFNPLEQDEENYKFHQENLNYFYADCTENLIVDDLNMEIFDCIS